MKKTFVILCAFLLVSCSSFQERVRVAVYSIPLMVIDDTSGTFDFDKSTLAESTFIVEEINRVLIERIKDKKGILKVVGHTDNYGSDEYNVILSRKRANTIANVVKTLLPKDNKIQFLIIPRGESDPVVPNDTAENRRKNRRVELFFDEADS
ncbi:MAG: OmpA family protein [Fusobacterium sp. JB021]|nr:OmpA family protein [Fusobacterium sp. JB021]MDP0507194.1 OmpA family protein [Fusobacterium sp. JB019]